MTGAYDRAVWEVSGSPRWRGEPRVWRHVDEVSAVDWDAVLGEAWSGGERLLLEAAASLCDPQYRVCLAELAARLDDDAFAAVVSALQRLREGLR